MTDKVLVQIITGVWAHQSTCTTIGAPAVSAYVGRALQLGGHMAHRLLASADVALCGPPAASDKVSSCTPLAPDAVQAACASYGPMVFAGEMCWQSGSGGVSPASFANGSGVVDCGTLMRLSQKEDIRHLLWVLRIEFTGPGRRRPLVVYRTPGIPSPSRLSRLSPGRLRQLLGDQAAARIAAYDERPSQQAKTAGTRAAAAQALLRQTRVPVPEPALV